MPSRGTIPRSARRVTPPTKPSVLKTAPVKPVTPLIYIDTNGIFKSVAPIDSPLMTCVILPGDDIGANLVFARAADIDELRRNVADGEFMDDADIGTLICESSETKGAEEAAFLRALADLIDAVSKQK